MNVSYATSLYVLPTTTIVDAVWTYEPDLVGIGTHGRRGFQRFVLGSVSERVVRRSPVAVLTVH